MNICLLFFSYGVWGGAETLTYELAKHLRDKGENVSIILNEEVQHYYTSLEKVSIFNIGPLYPPKSVIPHLRNTRGKRNRFSRLLSVPINYLDEVLRYQQYRNIRKDLIGFLTNNQVDVVNALLEEAVPLVSDLADDLGHLRIATVAILTGEPYLRGTEPTHLLSKPIMKRKARRFREALQNVDRVIAPSDFLLDAWEHQGITLKAKSVVAPCGINVPEIQGGRIPPSRLKGEFNVLFPGGNRFIKGGDLLFKSLPELRKQIPDIHVYVALDVPEGDMLRRMVSDLRLETKVTFVGHLPIQEYRKLLNSVDALVMPSRDEAFGIVYLEAMALGKPIVATNMGGIPEVVKDGRNGILVELAPGQIADAITRLYRNEDFRREMGQNNLQDVLRYDWSHLVDEYIDVYRDVCRQISTRSPRG